jgi:uncharacterized protein
VRRAAALLALAAALAAAAPPAAAARLEGTGAAAEEAGGFAAIPPLGGPVVDTTGTLSPEVRRRIEALALEVQQKTGAELAVLLVRTTRPEDVFSYGMRVAEAWKLGRRPRAGGPNVGGGDNGLLFVVALDDRKMHMFTGYGLEGILPDGRVGEILDRFVVPAFREGNVGAGVYRGLRAAAEVIAAEAGVELTGKPLLRAPGPPAIAVHPLVLLGVVVAVLLLTAAAARQAPRGRRRRRYGPVFWGGGFGDWGQRGGGFGSGGFGGGGGGGGGFGGGFGGGGSFGGGGAGRGW